MLPAVSPIHNAAIERAHAQVKGPGKQNALYQADAARATIALRDFRLRC